MDNYVKLLFTLLLAPSLALAQKLEQDKVTAGILFDDNGAATATMPLVPAFGSAKRFHQALTVPPAERTVLPVTSPEPTERQRLTGRLIAGIPLGLLGSLVSIPIHVLAISILLQRFDPMSTAMLSFNILSGIGAGVLISKYFSIQPSQRRAFTLGMIALGALFGAGAVVFYSSAELYGENIAKWLHRRQPAPTLSRQEVREIHRTFGERAAIPHKSPADSEETAEQRFRF